MSSADPCFVSGIMLVYFVSPKVDKTRVSLDILKIAVGIYVPQAVFNLYQERAG
jgi:hypothetical protein